MLLSAFHNCHCHCRIAFRLLLLWCSSCTWREERVGNALDSGRVDIVVDDWTVAGPCSSRLPCCYLCVMITIAIVGSRSGCSCCCGGVRLPLPLSERVPVDAEGRHGDKDVDRGRVDIVDAAKGLLSETNKHDKLDCSCNGSNRYNGRKHKIDR